MRNQLFDELARSAKRKAAAAAKKAMAAAKRSTKKSLTNAKRKLAKEIRITLGLKNAKKRRGKK